MAKKQIDSGIGGFAALLPQLATMNQGSIDAVRKPVSKIAQSEGNTRSGDPFPRLTAQSAGNPFYRPGQTFAQEDALRDQAYGRQDMLNTARWRGDMRKAEMANRPKRPMASPDMNQGISPMLARPQAPQSPTQPNGLTLEQSQGLAGMLSQFTGVDHNDMLGMVNSGMRTVGGQQISKATGTPMNWTPLDPMPQGMPPDVQQAMQKSVETYNQSQATAYRNAAQARQPQGMPGKLPMPDYAQYIQMQQQQQQPGGWDWGRADQMGALYQGADRQSRDQMNLGAVNVANAPKAIPVNPKPQAPLPGLGGLFLPEPWNQGQGQGQAQSPQLPEMPVAQQGVPPMLARTGGEQAAPIQPQANVPPAYQPNYQRPQPQAVPVNPMGLPTDGLPPGGQFEGPAKYIAPDGKTYLWSNLTRSWGTFWLQDFFDYMNNSGGQAGI